MSGEHYGLQDRPIADERAYVLAKIEEAAAYLFRSIESRGNENHRHYCVAASLTLRTAAALAGERRAALLAYGIEALRLGGVFSGDGQSVQALHDELRALVEVLRGEMG